jgi:hypothetical protein
LVFSVFVFFPCFQKPLLGLIPKQAQKSPHQDHLLLTGAVLKRFLFQLTASFNALLAVNFGTFLAFQPEIKNRCEFSLG